MKKVEYRLARMREARRKAAMKYFSWRFGRFSIQLFYRIPDLLEMCERLENIAEIFLSGMTPDARDGGDDSTSSENTRESGDFHDTA